MNNNNGAYFSFKKNNQYIDNIYRMKRQKSELEHRVIGTNY